MKPIQKKAARPRVLPGPVLASSFVVSAVIIGLCVWQAVALPADRVLYIALAAIALAYGVFIGVANHINKKKTRKR